MLATRPTSRPPAVHATPTTNLAEYMDRLFENMRNEMFSGLSPWGGLWAPGLEGRWLNALTDVEDKGTSYEIRANLPGIRKDNIEVKLQGHCLTIEASGTAEKEEKGKNYLSHERTYEGFCRSVELPEDVLSEKISANYRDGVLTVVVPKTNPAPERRISVA